MARLYRHSFSAKLGRILGHILGPDARAVAFFAQITNPEFALIARDTDGTGFGIAGFKTSNGARTGGGMRDIARHYGWLNALWKRPLLGLLERELGPDTLLMDGIWVDAAARGSGVGTALLDAVKKEARARPCPVSALM